MDESPFGFIVWDHQGNVAFWNKSAQTIFGWTTEEVQEFDGPDFLVCEENIDQTRKLLDLVLADHPVYDAVTPNRTKEGKKILCSWHLVTYKDADGRISHFATIVQEVTNQISGPSKELSSETLFQSSFQRAAVGLAFLDHDLVFKHVNPALCRIFGCARGYFERLELSNLIAEDEAGAIHSSLTDFQAGSINRCSISTKATKLDGTEIDIEISLSNISEAENVRCCTLCEIVDVSKDRKAEAALRQAHQEAESERRKTQEANRQFEEALVEAEQITVMIEQKEYALRTVIASISSILLVTNTLGFVEQWNPAAERTFGLASEEVVHRHIGALDLPWDSNLVENAINECLLTEQLISIDDLPYQTPEGKNGYFAIKVHPMQVPGRSVEGVLIVAADITERRLVERQLVLSQKMESLGELTAGIAHELNTPTQFVSDNTRYVRDSFKKIAGVVADSKSIDIDKLDAQGLRDALQAVRDKWASLKGDVILQNVPEALDESLDGLKRIATIVRAMKDFSHPGVDGKSTVDLNRCIESTVTVARNEWKYVADLELKLDPNMPMVPCVPGQINQVILNILVNATHAVADACVGEMRKGTITVSTYFNEKWAYFAIRDSGTGIRAEIKDRIFDPFFTTKDVGRGTGQGLALVHSVIVGGHQGQILVDSEIGVGTTMTVCLPLTQAEESAA